MTDLWDVKADPLEFDEAIDFFQRKTPITKDEWLKLDEAARLRAFTVAGVAQADIVSDVWTALTHAIANGESLEEFKKSVGDTLRSAWQGTVENPPWRLETIFRTNTQTAYSAGRVAQLSHPDVKEARPYWQFDAVEDNRTTEVCEKCDGTVRPANDPWWHTHTPPLHFNCRSSFNALDHSTAHKIGVATHGPSVAPAQGFGGIPSLDKWRPEAANYPAPIAQAIGDKMKHAAPPPPLDLPTPPKPKTLTKGTHFAEVVTPKRMSKAARKELDSAIETTLASQTHPVVVDALEKMPLSKLHFAPKVKLGRRAVNGWRSPADKGEIAITIDRTPSPEKAAAPYGRSPDSLWSMSTAGTTPEQARARTLTHEIGHQVHMHGAFAPRVTPDEHKLYRAIDAVVRQSYNQRHTAITRYADDSAHEYFAESFAAYVHDPAALKKHDPNGYAMVEKVNAMRGLKP